MFLVLKRGVEAMRDALPRWHQPAKFDGRCQSCGEKVEAPLQECLHCLSTRHW